MELARGTPIGPYRVDALIARGGMGAVYRARRADGAVVALKLLQADVSRPDRRARFEREAELTARLAHPNVVRVHGAGAVGPLHYLVMDLVDGEPLSAVSGRLSAPEAMRAVAEVARGIEHAHARGVLHRDIKPGNVLVRRDDGVALVTDFGIARAMDSGSSLTKTGAMVGTPFYMAPEQITGEPVTTATDVHGLGLLLYEALTGVAPFQRGELAAVCHAVTEHAPPPPSSLRPDIPRAVDRLCAQALAKDPARRPTAGALADELEAALAAPDAPRRAAPRAVVALLLVAACAVGGLLVRQHRSTATSDGTPASAAVVVTRAAPSVEPPPPAVAAPEPDWVRALTSEGDLDALRAAEQGTRGERADALSPVARDAALKAAERLARRWRTVSGDLASLDEQKRAEVRVAAERLILIHALRLRLDPRSRVPDEVAPTLHTAGFVAGLPTDSTQFAHALVEVLPDDLPAHTVYCATLKLASDERVLRRGLDLAEAAEDWLAWRSLAGMLGDQLGDRARDADPARAVAARAALDALVEEGVARADRNTDTAWTLLKVAARVAFQEGRYDDGLRHWDRALPYFPSAWDGHSFRAGAACEAFRATGDPDHAAVVAADLEALLRSAEANPAACEALVTVLMQAVNVLALQERYDEVLAALDRAAAVAPPAAFADPALARVVHEARRGRPERARPALEHLARCLDARRERVAAVLTETDRTRFAQLQEVVRQALARDDPLDRAALADALEAHPARRYLFVDFAPLF